MDWELLGFIKASKYRTNILRLLQKKNRTPLELAQELEYYITHVSTTLRELREKNLVVCLTPNLKKGKIYSLTELGKNIVPEI